MDNEILLDILEGQLTPDKKNTEREHLLESWIVALRNIIRDMGKAYEKKFRTER